MRLTASYGVLRLSTRTDVQDGNLPTGILPTMRKPDSAAHMNYSSEPLNDTLPETSLRTIGTSKMSE